MRYLFLVIIFMFSCKKDIQKKAFEGEIYITLINVYSARTIVPLEKLNEFKEEINNFDKRNKSEDELKLHNYYKTLIKYGLFDKYCFQLKLISGEIINVYIDDDKYLKLLKKELKNLDRDKQKINVRFTGKKVSEGIYNRAIYSASSILSIEKTKGKTDWQK